MLPGIPGRGVTAINDAWCAMSFDAAVDPGGPDSGVAIDPWFATLWAPLLVGIALWLAASAVSMAVRMHREKRERRLRIVGALNRAESIVFRAVRDGDYERAWISESHEPLRESRVRYDDLTVETLDLFKKGEEDVAQWVAAELYAGFLDPLYYLDGQGLPREPSSEGWPLIHFEARGRQAPQGWTPPRSDMLLLWAGGGKGPRYGDLYSAGDHYRHHIVRPNSDVNSDMLRPPVWSLKNRGDGAKSSHWSRSENPPPRPAPGELENCGVCWPRFQAQRDLEGR